MPLSAWMTVGTLSLESAIEDGADEGQLFQNKVRLEVSGIRKGDSSRIKARLKQKKEQTKVSDGQFPAYIIVVEFSTPLSYVEKR